VLSFPTIQRVLQPRDGAELSIPAAAPRRHFFKSAGDTVNRMRAAIAVLLLACGCTTASEPPQDAPRDTLFDTGLCLDRACTQIASDAIEYQPRFELWANGATKRRWIQLPAGAKIDTSDMDHWGVEGVHARRRSRRDAVYRQARR